MAAARLVIHTLVSGPSLRDKSKMPVLKSVSLCAKRDLELAE